MKKTVQTIYRELDRIVSDTIVAWPSLVKCKIGCADCCHAVFDVSLVEGQLILEAFRSLDRKKRREITRRAEKAMKQWKKITGKANSIEDIGRERIRCPFLGRKNICAIYASRPVNCRTYGIPLEIDGKATVCGLSGFKEGESYQTVNMNRLHDRLCELSVELSPEDGRKRWPLASIILSA